MWIGQFVQPSRNTSQLFVRNLSNKLAGDVAHKFTTSTGAGCNNGTTDKVFLLNKVFSKMHALLGAVGTDLTGP